MTNMKKNNLFSKSKPTRFYFDHYGEVCRYETHLSAPLLILCDQLDLREKMREDGLSLDAVTKKLQQCALSQPAVERITISYTGYGYSLVILLGNSPKTQISEIYNYFETSCREYGEHRPIVNVLNSIPKDWMALPAIDSHLVYENSDKSSIPLRPLSG